jgi:CheY-like chemotaxis protein
MNIILVDDDLDDVLLFREAIKDISKAINCVELESGADLLNYLEVAVYPPRMIFLDYNMPGMNGLECLKEIRRSQKFDDIPVIIYTTYLNEDQERNCLQNGATVLFKPNTYSELVEVVEAKIFEITSPLTQS